MRRTWQHHPVRRMSLARQLLLLQLAVVLVAVAVAGAIAVRAADDRAQEQQRVRVLSLAQTLADSGEVRAALRRRDPSAVLQPLAERVRGVAHVDFITIMRPDGIRYTHRTPGLIGKRFVGTYKPAAQGHTVIETTRGTLGRSVRAVVPVRDDGRIVALVAVGVLTRAIGDEVVALLPGLLGLAAASSARRSASSRRRSRRCTPTTTRPCMPSERA
jgi:sensor histidine kinase regulating citrate/malate metabolism